MTQKEQLTPGDPQNSIENMRLLADFANGTTVFPAADTELSNEYRDAVLQYGNYCMKMLLDPQLSNLLTDYNGRKDSQVTLASTFSSDSVEKINLERSFKGPQLFLRVERSIPIYDGNRSYIDTYRSNFAAWVTKRYKDSKNNPWSFKEAHPWDTFSGSLKWFFATKIFSPEDLLNNELFRAFVSGTTKVVKNLNTELMLEKVGTTDQARVRTMIDAITQANNILGQALNPQ